MFVEVGQWVFEKSLNVYDMLYKSELTKLQDSFATQRKVVEEEILDQKQQKKCLQDINQKEAAAMEQLQNKYTHEKNRDHRIINVDTFINYLQNGIHMVPESIPFQILMMNLRHADTDCSEDRCIDIINDIIKRVDNPNPLHSSDVCVFLFVCSIHVTSECY